MPIDFPASPSVDDTFSSAGKTWKFNGTSWALIVGTSTLADGSVTSAKIAPSAVTEDKLATNAVTTNKILDGTITQAKLAEGVGGGGGLDTTSDGAIITMDIGA